MFRRHRHRLSRFGRLDDVLGFADDLHAHGPFRTGAFGRRRRSRGPSWGTLLLAGLAGLALAWLMSRGNRSNLSKGQKILLGGLIVAVGAVVLTLRRRADRYRWSI